MLYVKDESTMSANQLKRLRKKRAKEEQRLLEETAVSASKELDEQREKDVMNLREMYSGVVAPEVVDMVFENSQHSFDRSIALLCEMVDQQDAPRQAEQSLQWGTGSPELLDTSCSHSPTLQSQERSNYETIVATGDDATLETERETRGRLWASSNSRGGYGSEEEWEQWDEESVGAASVEGFMHSMFSHMEPGMVTAILRESNEDVETAVENLLRASLVPDDETMSLQSTEDRLFSGGSSGGSFSSDEEEAPEESGIEDDDDELWQQWPEDLGWETLDIIAKQQEELERYMLDEYLLEEDTRQLRTSNVLLRTNKLAQLQEMFPEERRSTLMEYLNAEAGDMDRVVALIQSAPPSQQERALRKKLKKLRKEAKRGKTVNVRDLHTISSAQLSSAWVGKDLRDRSTAIQGYHSAPSLADLRRSADDNFPSLTSSPPPPSLAWNNEGAVRGQRGAKTVPKPSYPMDEDCRRKYEHLVLSYHWLDEYVLEELFVANDMSLTRTTTALSELYGPDVYQKECTPSETSRARGQTPSSWKKRKAGHFGVAEGGQAAKADVEEEGEEERVPYCGPAEKNTRVPRAYEKVKKTAKDFQPVLTRGSKKKMRQKQRKSGTPISGSVRAGSKYRGQAMMHAQLRNEYYRNAARAFVNGDGKLAKELSQKGREQGRLMETNNSLAADHFFNSKNYVVSGMQHVDLHGMHLQEALDRIHGLIVKYQQMDKGSRPVGLHIITGEGNHSVGGRPVIKPGIVQYLSGRRLRFRQHSGVVVVYL